MKFKCWKCRKFKACTAFNKNSFKKRGLSDECRICKSDLDREYRLKYPDRIQEYKRTHKNFMRCSKYKRKYGITLLEYLKLLEKQNYKCKICKQGETYHNPYNKKLKKNLAVDHCHKSGHIRGLLCGNCNKGLGLFKDDTTLLSRAGKYIKKNGDII